MLSALPEAEPLIFLLNKYKQAINQNINPEMVRQSFTPTKTAIGDDTLFEIPRNQVVYAMVPRPPFSKRVLRMIKIMEC